MIKKFSNKLVLTLITLLMSTVASADVKLSFGEFGKITPGSVFDLPVILDSDDDIKSLSFDLRLPEGLSAIMAEKNNSRAKGSGWTCNVTPAPDNEGAFRFGLINFSKYILAGEGEIAFITIEAGDVIEDGDITFENVEVIMKDESVADVETEAGSVEVTNVYPGLMSFTAETSAIVPNGVFTITVSLANDVPLTGFTAYVTLPEGFEIVPNEDDDFITPGARVPENYQWSYNETTGKIGLLKASTADIDDESGVLFSFNVKAPEEIDPESTITLTNFIGSVKGSMASFDFDSDIELNVFGTSKVLPGDIDKDGDVDAEDLALFIQALAAQQLPTGDSDDFARYDANQNGVINIADAQAIFNIFMYGNASGR